MPGKETAPKCQTSCKAVAGKVSLSTVHQIILLDISSLLLFSDLLEKILSFTILAKKLRLLQGEYGISKLNSTKVSIMIPGTTILQYF